MDVSGIDQKGPNIYKELDPQVSVSHHPWRICCILFIHRQRHNDVTALIDEARV